MCLVCVPGLDSESRRILYHVFRPGLDDETARDKELDLTTLSTHIDATLSTLHAKRDSTARGQCCCTLPNMPVFRPSATVSRNGLMESRVRRRCRGGPPLATPPG